MELTEILNTLVGIKSISGDKRECQKLIDLIAKMIPGAVVSDDTNTIWWGHTDLSTTKWLINTHIDVVPASVEQFKLTKHKDRIYGRGALDVKGCAAILVSNADRWVEIARSKAITFMLVSDEEIGGDSTKRILKTMNGLEGALFLEPTNLQIVTKAKGMMQIKITSTGRSSHGSRPWVGDNAIEKLIRDLVQFRLTHPSPSLETRDTTYNFSQIIGGKAINQVPSHSELWCDVRFNPAVNPEMIILLMKDIFKSCEITVVKSESPINCDRNTTVFQTLSKSLKACSINPIAKFDHATSDARHATKLGVPALVFGPRGSGQHSLDEWVSLKSLEKVKIVLDHWIKNI